MIESLELREFTTFHRLKIEFSAKINIIIGANGTGKSQLLKAAYALCSGESKLKSGNDIKQDDIETELAKLLTSLFMPLDGKLGKMRKNGAGTDKANLKSSFTSGTNVELEFSNNATKKVQLENITHFQQKRAEPVFFPTKEVLALMKGFVSLYQQRELSFDRTYQDICLQLDLPPIRPEKLTERAKWAMAELERVCGGRFIFYGGGNVTFKSSKDGTEYSANAIAEGFRKAGMLSRLLETGTISPGESGPLFWDEPEANMNPKLMELLVQILLELSRNGQQIILATHEYVLLKWFDLLKTSADHIRYHALYQDTNTGEIKIDSTDDYQSLTPNAISDSFNDLTKKQVSLKMGNLGK
ncbi:ATP/GTP-binding protein [Endozoicomonas sp. ONNA2]|uniref:AAA family ATPase n=1 Tax=Endozoicomonas sp. ONNA2 TaxID=2828741 RepID=UPI0021484A07|nr:AAA family ATPase [Endozoicomonas sp. ONNA2]